MNNGWRYYNHAIVPNCAPHEIPETESVTDGSIWKIYNTGGGTPLLVRWTSDFDCGFETNWWYCIKDDPFDINALKAKRRYVVNQGKRNFTVRRIDPRECAEELIQVQIKAFSAYPAKNRPAVNKEAQLAEFNAWSEQPDKNIVLGAFDREGILSGYCHVILHENYCGLASQKTDPSKEHLQINAALVTGVLEKISIGRSYYIADGARNVSHETHFQDYLEKYFGFRKAYCKLHIRYRPIVGAAVKILYPMRRLLKKLDSIGLIHRINGVLLMEEIVRAGKAMENK